MPDKRLLQTSAGDFPLDEYRFGLAGREWKILHVSAVLSHEEEAYFLRELREHLPYGVTLWASAIALAHEVAARGASLRGQRVLELGSGTGLPGIVAASHGAQVVQTDRNDLVMALCRRNVELNNVAIFEQRLVDWIDWQDAGRYELIIGSDILYDKEMHTHLQRIFQSNLAAGGKVLLSDPFREVSINFLETLEAEGWSIIMSKWSIGESSAARPIGIFELLPPTSL